MRFDVVTLFPELIQDACNYSILKRAMDANLLEINTINPRDYTLDKHKKVDDTPFGGGAGMVLGCQPFLDAVKSIELNTCAKKIILTPQGKRFNHSMAKEFASFEQLVIICGHYEGFDERIRVLSGAEEVSIGDFVLTGGEYPALCIIDSVLRLKKGVLGDDSSAEYDSHSDGLLEYPQYTKPREYESFKVPDVLLSGNHKEITRWRRIEQFKRTKEKRPDLFDEFLNSELSKEDKKLLKELNRHVV